MSFGTQDALIFLYPGQSSRAVGMLDPLRARTPRLVEETLARASEALGRDLGQLDAAFTDNRSVQVGVFLANHLHLRSLEELGLAPTASAGLSLGEYNHLVDIGALDLMDALRLVDERGRLYDEGPSGVMAAVFPVTSEEIAEVLAQVDGEVWVSNENSLTQQVIAGEPAAVADACARAEDQLYAHTHVIERRIPMHTPRFAPVAERLGAVLRGASWRPARRTYWSNVTASSQRDPSADELARSMTRHVCEPVRWQRQLEALVAAHPRACFVEVGPRTVLRDLMRRSGLEVRCLHTSSAAGWAELERLRAGAPEGSHDARA